MCARPPSHWRAPGYRCAADLRCLCRDEGAPLASATARRRRSHWAGRVPTPSSVRRGASEGPETPPASDGAQCPTHELRVRPFPCTCQPVGVSTDASLGRHSVGRVPCFHWAAVTGRGIPGTAPPTHSAERPNHPTRTWPSSLPPGSGTKSHRRSRRRGPWDVPVSAAVDRFKVCPACEHHGSAL